MESEKHIDNLYHEVNAIRQDVRLNSFEGQLILCNLETVIDKLKEHFLLLRKPGDSS